MESEGSLPHLQEPAASPFPESDQSIPFPNHTSWRSTSRFYSYLLI